MKARALLGAVLAVHLLAGPGWSQASSAGQEKKEEKKKDEKKDEKKPDKLKTGAKAPAKEETKYFQLAAVTIDVVEKARDVETPNMTVVKPELFPLSIGTTIDTALERQAGVNIQRIQEVGTAMDDDSVKIRGLSGRRLKVLRDGRLLNTSGAAGGYSVDFTMIPLTDVDRVEIVKGVGDARYGNSLGGIATLLADSLVEAGRSVDLWVRAGVGASAVTMRVVGAEVLSASVEGRPVDRSRYRYQSPEWGMTYWAPPDSGYRLGLVLPAGSDARLELVTQRQGLDGVPLPPRPPHVVPSQTGDVRLAYRSISLAPPSP